MAERIPYGTDPLQWADLHRPAGRALGVVVLIHGGYWRYDPTYVDGPTGIALDLASRGYAVWQLEYRAMGARGGYPQTLEDVAAGIDALADVDLGVSGLPVITLGHSAGGHLAVWALSRPAPRVPLTGAISLAGVLDLRVAEHERLGRGAVRNFLGGSSRKHPERFEAADPIRRIVPALPVRLIHGTDDRVVPLPQSLNYRDAALAAGQDGRLVEAPVDHFEIIETGTVSYPAILAAVGELTGSATRR